MDVLSPSPPARLNLFYTTDLDPSIAFVQVRLIVSLMFFTYTSGSYYPVFFFTLFLFFLFIVSKT